MNYAVVEFLADPGNYTEEPDESKEQTDVANVDVDGVDHQEQE